MQILPGARSARRIAHLGVGPSPGLRATECYNRCMRPMHRCRLTAACAGALLGVALFAARLPLRAAEPEGGEVVFRSPDLRIFRTLDRHGSPTVVLTNLDEDGNRMGDDEETVCPAASPAPEARPPAAKEVPADAVHDGVTIVVNINNPPSPPPEATGAVPSLYPLFSVPGLPAAFRYPDHLPFLGYGLDTSSPSFFGGLGLNAGNRFGLSSGRPCGHGYDCLFGPRGD